MRMIIIGVGGYGQTVADMAGQSGLFEKISFLDDRAEGDSVLGSLRRFSQISGR